MEINEIAIAIRQTAIEHGWESSDREPGTWIALAHSELSEALEIFREGHPLGEMWNREDGKPEGFLTELADTIIRCLHHMQFILDKEEITIGGEPYWTREGIGYISTPKGPTREARYPLSIESILLDKMQYNSSREYRHGGKQI